MQWFSPPRSVPSMYLCVRRHCWLPFESKQWQAQGMKHSFLYTKRVKFFNLSTTGAWKLEFALQISQPLPHSVRIEQHSSVSTRNCCRYPSYLKGISVYSRRYLRRIGHQLSPLSFLREVLIIGIDSIAFRSRPLRTWDYCAVAFISTSWYIYSRWLLTGGIQLGSVETALVRRNDNADATLNFQEARTAAHHVRNFGRVTHDLARSKSNSRPSTNRGAIPCSTQPQYTWYLRDLPAWFKSVYYSNGHLLFPMNLKSTGEFTIRDILMPVFGRPGIFIVHPNFRRSGLHLLRNILCQAETGNK